MRTRKLAVAFGVATALVVGLGVSTARADRVDCADVQAALAGGQSIAEVPETLGTTRTRVEACARVAEAHARHAERRQRVDAQRAARRIEKKP